MGIDLAVVLQRDARCAQHLVFAQQVGEQHSVGQPRRDPAAMPSESQHFLQVVSDHGVTFIGKPAAHRIGTLALAHLGNRAGNAWIALGEEVGKDFAAQEVTFAVLHRARSRQDARLARESSEEVLREGVDRIDPQSAAGAIEDAGEQRPGPRARFWVAGRAQKRQFARQLRIANEADAEAWIARLEDLPRYFDDHIANIN